MNQIYKRNEFVVIPVKNNFIIINKDKIFKEGHTHVREMKIARLLVDLAVKRELPRNFYYVDRLMRITRDEKYINELKEYKENAQLKHNDYKKMMEEGSVYKKSRGAYKQIK